MKKIVGAVAIILIALNSNADLTKFRWYNTAAGNLKNNAATDIATGATVLTYLSTDNTIDYLGGFLSASVGNDTFYQALGTLSTGRLVVNYMTETVTDYRGRFSYAIVLDMPLATFTGTYSGNVALVPAGTYYQKTSMFGPLADMDVIPAPVAQSFNAGSIQTTEVIPEPATALLFGIGGMGAWILRRSKIKSQEEGEEADA